MTVSGYDQRDIYIRAGPTKDLEFCRFVDEDFQRRDVDSANDWREQIAAGGSATIQDDTAGGVYRLTTGGGATDNVILDRNNIRIVDPSLKPLLCIRAMMVTIANVNIELRLGLVDVFDTDHCVFEVDQSAHGNLSIYAESYNAGGQTETVDTGIDLDAAWHIYEIFVNSDGRPFWYIDGVEENEGDDADVDPTEFFQPYVEIYTEDANAKSLDVDFVKGWQMRA